MHLLTVQITAPTSFGRLGTKLNPGCLSKILSY